MQEVSGGTETEGRKGITDYDSRLRLFMPATLTCSTPIYRDKARCSLCEDAESFSARDRTGAPPSGTRTNTAGLSRLSIQDGLNCDYGFWDCSRPPWKMSGGWWIDLRGRK